ncbi:nucleosome assembly protein 1-like 5 [Perognathus longimembris pacificus]|uniref:nucleosome assembly protein 1-like 5 n=1 Tax=Perognathus longimembris pacificus TaxID=214514 RepID=UPI002019ACBA|nr:nucleosome assembly protein 1-like 5 [Perognathus longimembris pacificus]
MADSGKQGSAEPAAAAGEGRAAGTGAGMRRPSGTAPAGREFVERLPRAVQCRVLALKKLQSRCGELEAAFHQELRALERKYDRMCQPLRARIQDLAGEMESCSWSFEGEDQEDSQEDGDEEEEDREEAAAAAARRRNDGPDTQVPDAACREPNEECAAT